ncbi:MAG: hypothetical protein ACJAZP_000738 [Psychromonas sp.]|uniref:DUF6279 family lipoprotein n=1 Tax=Psychromonas sp. TaxID=1884585 RepID=UPI0039E2B3D4
MNYKLFFLLSFCCLLYGCTNKFVYNNMDWISKWYLDDYVELNAQQNIFLASQLNAVHYWHRHHELAEYRNQLVKFSDDLKQLPISTEKLQAHLHSIEMHWQRLRRKGSYYLSQMAPLLNAQQVNYLFDYLEQKNQHRLQQFKAQSLQEYNNKKYQRIVDFIEDRLGSTTVRQKSFVQHFVSKSELTQVEYVAYVRRYQQALRSTFESENPRTLRVELNKLLNDSSKFMTPEYKQKSNENRQLAMQLLFEISSTLTEKQLLHLRTEIKDLIRLIDKLVAD